MATTVRLLPSSYTLSNTTYLTISNADNMYTNVDSSTYATINHTRARTTSYYIYIKGFDFSQIPSDATITSATVKVKANESNATAYIPSLYNNTTAISGTSLSGSIDTSIKTVSLDITSNWDTYKNYGTNLGIRLTLNRSSQNTASSMNIYGAEIEVTYELPVTQYTITSTITNGTMVSENPLTVNEGDNAEIKFNGKTGFTFSSMTIDGVNVQPITNLTSKSALSITYSTNYGAYSSYAFDNCHDGNTSTYFWSNEAQATGKYILITFSEKINLKSFSTYSSNSTDYLQSNNYLQVSSDNNTWTDIGAFTNAQTTTFSSITTANNIKYIRIYAKSDITNWLVLNTITMDYEEVNSLTSEYSYTINAVDSDKTIIIIFSEIPKEEFLIKVNGAWVPVTTIYKKVDGAWIVSTYTYDNTKKLIYKGHIAGTGGPTREEGKSYITDASMVTQHPSKVSNGEAVVSIDPDANSLSVTFDAISEGVLINAGDLTGGDDVRVYFDEVTYSIDIPETAKSYVGLYDGSTYTNTSGMTPSIDTTNIGIQINSSSKYVTTGGGTLPITVTYKNFRYEKL